jgi:hypothetical protein
MAKGKWIEPTGTTLTFTGTGVSFTLDWVTITPAPLEGGEAIDTTSLANTQFKTSMPQTLISCGDLTFSGELNADALDDAVDSINKEATAVVVVGNGGGTFTYYGYLKSVTPGSLTAGEKATMDGVFAVTNTVTTAYVPTETAPTFATGA